MQPSNSNLVHSSHSLHRITHPEAGDAESIFTAVSGKLDEQQVTIEKSLIATAADGASVNFGRESGLLVRLQKAGAPWMLKIHCLAHRLELSLADAFSDTYFNSEVRNFLIIIHARVLQGF